MSTSPRRAPAEAPPDKTQPSPLEPFPYDPIPADAGGAAGLGKNFAGLSSPHPAEQAHAAARQAQALSEARQQGQSEARQSFEEQLAKERSQVAALLARFVRDRGSYFEEVEAEVVQLALSIARKILHREAQVDPLLLAGMVRVALEKIDGATHVLLRVHPQNAADWRRYLATQMDPAELPEIVEDPSQPEDCCRLETSMGSALIGVEVQLKEIEQGLMDLLAARPGAGT